MNTTLSLRPATVADIDYIMMVERLPGYPERVGVMTADEHARRMVGVGTNYLIGMLLESPAGFAVLRHTDDNMANIGLRRIAVEQAGRGIGRRFLGAICNHVFSELGMWRLWLDVLPSNSVARHVYAKAGFVEEGLMRSALRYPDGSRADLLLMSLLREDWYRLPADYRFVADERRGRQQ